MTQLNVAVLMGGVSGEREVSLASGKQVVKALGQLDMINPIPIEINQSGQWLLDQTRQPVIISDNHSRELITLNANRPDIQNRLGIDVVLIILHGKNGEDGTIQGLLELYNVPYVGSDVLASALAMDKLKSRIIFETAGLAVPELEHVVKKSKSIPQDITLPVVVKPNAAGSSLGVTICHAKEQIEPAIGEALKFDDTVLVERFVQGRELTCSVLGEDQTADVLPVTEIIPINNAFYNYQSKYQEGGSRHIVPAVLTTEETKLVQESAKTAHIALGCRDMSRTDFILTDSGLFTLETNTIPGMTATSLLPEAAQKAGIEFPQLLERLINMALERSKQ